MTEQDIQNILDNHSGVLPYPLFFKGRNSGSIYAANRVLHMSPVGARYNVVIAIPRGAESSRASQGTCIFDIKSLVTDPAEILRASVALANMENQDA